MQIYINNQVLNLREAFPNVSFPNNKPSEEFLTRNNALIVQSFKPFDVATQKLVSCNVYIESGNAYNVTVEDKTEEEIAEELALKAIRMRSARDDALAASDWTQVADAPVDQAAWATYRQALRNLPQAEGWPNVNLPTDPTFTVPTGNSE